LQADRKEQHNATQCLVSDAHVGRFYNKSKQKSVVKPAFSQSLH
jgi:hypothetical protein